MVTAIGQSNILQALGWAVFNSLWQMAILWVAYQFIISVFRVNRSSQKGLLASLLLFAGFAWFAWTLGSGIAARSGPDTPYIGMLNLEGNQELSSWLATMLPLASIAYLVLLLLPVLNFIRNYRYVQVIRRYGLSRADVQWRMFVQKISGQMSIGKTVRVWMSDLVSSPVTVGYLKPIILLPLAAVNHLSTRQIEAVLLHELSHIKRQDYFINLMVKCVQTILYFNPFVKAFAKIIEREREKSCDETVIQFQYEPHGYASALLALEKAAQVPQHMLTVGASDGRKSDFRQRIEWIMGVRNQNGFSFNKLAGVLAALLCFIALNAVVIISKPSNHFTASRDSLSLLSSPVELFAGDKAKNTAKETNNAAVAENSQATIANNIDNRNEETNVSESENETGEANTGNEAFSPFQFVYNLENIIPKLNAEQEKQVEEAVQESKKVVQEIQWKDLEKSIADALTMYEKERIKQEYNKVIGKADVWNKVGNKLRVAYDQINWDEINKQLDNAIAEIRIDSLQQVYTLAIDNLSTLQKELVKEDQKGIPDTDISLQSIESKKKEIEKAIIKLKKMKPLKIVEL